MLCDEKDRRNEDSERDDQGRCPDAAAPWGEVLRVVRSGHRKVATVRLGWLEQRRPQAELSRRIWPRAETRFSELTLPRLCLAFRRETGAAAQRP